jgi:hypothetical protein
MLQSGLYMPQAGFHEKLRGQNTHICLKTKKTINLKEQEGYVGKS